MSHIRKGSSQRFNNLPTATLLASGRATGMNPDVFGSKPYTILLSFLRTPKRSPSTKSTNYLLTPGFVTEGQFLFVLMQIQLFTEHIYCASYLGLIIVQAQDLHGKSCYLQSRGTRRQYPSNNGGV